ncbi:MAG TPA: hypothetical protein VF789_30765 [Thermoanaerobaculia bacterium]
MRHPFDESDDPDPGLHDFDDPAEPPRMPREELKARFDELADRLSAARRELEALYPELREKDDQKAVEQILTDLVWAVENCTVIGLHQIGEALEDRM